MRAQSRIRRVTALTAGGVLALGFIGVGTAPAFADNFEVDNYGDLVIAINSANGIPGQDAIIITGNFALTGPLPPITDDLTIVGNNRTIDVDGQALGFVVGFVDPPGVLAISNLTIENAGADGLLVAEADIWMTNVTVTGSARDGLSASGSTLRIVDSHFDANGRDGALVTGPSAESRITDTSFDRNGRYGMYLHSFSDDGALAVVGGSANGNGSIGVRPYVSRGYLEIIGLQANGNGSHGIEMDLENGARALLGTVEISHNRAKGAFIWASNDSYLELDDVTAVDNGDRGFDLSIFDQATLDASELSAVENTGDGIYLKAAGGATVTVEDSVALGNDEAGVRVEVSETLVSLLRVDVIDNHSSGFLVNADEGGEVVIEDATASGNEYAGLFAEPVGAKLTVTGSTFTENAVGIEVYYGTEQNEPSQASVINSTISGNGPGPDTGYVTGIWAGGGDERSEFLLANSTVVDNDSDPSLPGVGILDVAAHISHSIVWGNTGSDLGTPFDSAGDVSVEYSLIGDHGDDPLIVAALAAGTGNLIGADPLLGPLADNGGPTRTHLPQAGSPAIDAGDPAFSGLATDQRGRARISGPRIDIGAVEVRVSGGGGGGLADSGSSGGTPLLGGALLLLLGGAVVLARRMRARTV